MKSEHSAEALQRVIAPIEQAVGLENAFYTSQQAFESEQQKVFFSQWAGVGFAKDAAQPGDAAPINFLGMPLLLVRDRSGTLRVFQNTCRHRGMVLITEKTRINGAIRCPYHSWCYALDGALKSTPHVGGPGHNIHEDIDPDTLGLIEVRSHVYLGVVFVNVDGQAPAFEAHHAELLSRWSEFDKPIFHGGDDSGFKLTVNCNWKLAVENYCESYHLPWVHPGLNAYSRLEDHYNIVSESGHSGQGTEVYRPTLSEQGDHAFDDFEGLSERWDTAAEYIALFPNVLLGVHRDHTFAIVLEPVAPDKTIEHIELFYASDAMTAPGQSTLRTQNAALWKTVFEEDIFVVEGMQRGRAGVHFDGGKFSPVMDVPTHTFHRWVAERLIAVGA